MSRRLDEGRAGDPVDGRALPHPSAGAKSRTVGEPRVIDQTLASVGLHVGTPQVYPRRVEQLHSERQVIVRRPHIVVIKKRDIPAVAGGDAAVAGSGRTASRLSGPQRLQQVKARAQRFDKSLTRHSRLEIGSVIDDERFEILERLA
jgi:hypothetical protein